MKVLKNIGSFFCFIIIFCLLCLIIDYLRINISYYIHKDEYIDDFPVYGNSNNYVPQGLAYSSLYNVSLQSSYNSKHDVSKVYIVDFNLKKIIKELELRDNNNEPIKYHVGGIATDNNKVWISNDYIIYEFSLEEIINTNESHIKSLSQSALPIRGDFCTYHNNALWVGDFYLKPFYDVPNGDPLLLNYSNIDNLDYNSPSFAISIPKMIQGLTFNDKGEFVFTASFTYLINSKFTIYRDITNNANKNTINIGNKNIPHYKFTNSDIVKSSKLPPMAEGIFYKDGFYYILFENSTDSYPLALPRMKNVIKYK